MDKNAVTIKFVKCISADVLPFVNHENAFTSRRASIGYRATCEYSSYDKDVCFHVMAHSE